MLSVFHLTDFVFAESIDQRKVAKILNEAVKSLMNATDGITAVLTFTQTAQQSRSQEMVLTNYKDT